MTRNSNDLYDDDGNLQDGFDYDIQAWVKDYKICDCGHRNTGFGNLFNKPKTCCNAGKLAGQDIRDVKKAYKKAKDRYDQQMAN